MAGINHEIVKAHGEKGLHTEWNADHKQKGNHDCEQFQHLNHVWENRTDWPAGPVKGQVVFRTDFNNAFVWNGTIWISLSPVATIVVAVDGTGNYLTIQEGIDALPAGGGVVYVKEGIYLISAKITINKDAVTIIGAGHSTIVRNTVQLQYLVEVAVNTDYCVIDKIQFDALGTLTGLGSVITFLGATTNSKISGCWFDHWGPRGIIFLNAGENISVDNCVFETVATAGPNYAILGNNSSFSSLRGNFIYGGTNCYGVQLVTATIKHFSILDNKFYDCVVPVSVIGVGEITMTGNFMGGFTYGIWLNTSSNNIILGNEMDVGTVGVFVEDNSDYNNIGNNRIRNCDWGVVIDAVAENQNSVVNNTLVGNTVALVDNGTASEIGHNTT